MDVTFTVKWNLINRSVYRPFLPGIPSTRRTIYGALSFVIFTRRCFGPIDYFGWVAAGTVRFKGAPWINSRPANYRIIQAICIAIGHRVCNANVFWNWLAKSALEMLRVVCTLCEIFSRFLTLNLLVLFIERFIFFFNFFFFTFWAY